MTDIYDLVKLKEVEGGYDFFFYICIKEGIFKDECVNMNSYGVKDQARWANNAGVNLVSERLSSIPGQ